MEHVDDETDDFEKDRFMVKQGMICFLKKGETYIQLELNKYCMSKNHNNTNVKTPSKNINEHLLLKYLESGYKICCNVSNKSLISSETRSIKLKIIDTNIKHYLKYIKYLIHEIRLDEIYILYKLLKDKLPIISYLPNKYMIDIINLCHIIHIDYHCIEQIPYLHIIDFFINEAITLGTIKNIYSEFYSSIVVGCSDEYLSTFMNYIDFKKINFQDLLKIVSINAYGTLIKYFHEYIEQELYFYNVSIDDIINLAKQNHNNIRARNIILDFLETSELLDAMEINKLRNNI